MSWLGQKETAHTCSNFTWYSLGNLHSQIFVEVLYQSAQRINICLSPGNTIDCSSAQSDMAYQPLLCCISRLNFALLCWFLKSRGLILFLDSSKQKRGWFIFMQTLIILSVLCVCVTQNVFRGNYIFHWFHFH